MSEYEILMTVFTVIGLLFTAIGLVIALYNSFKNK